MNEEAPGAFERWALGSRWPGRILQVAHVVADNAGTAIALVLGAGSFTLASAALVLGLGFAWSWFARGALLHWRDAMSLGKLASLLKDFPPASVHRVVDYFPEGICTAPGERQPLPHADWTIIHARGIPPTAYPYAPWRSFILYQFLPGEMTPVRAFGLLHEMGHMGPRNYLTATSEMRHRRLDNPNRSSLDELNRLILRRLRLVLTRPRMMRAFLAQLPRRPALQWFGLVAVAPLFMFAVAESPLVWMFAFMAATFAGSLNRTGIRMEAEVEADHFAVSQLTLRAIEDGPGSPDAKRYARFFESYAPLRDADLSETDHETRTRAFAWMRIEGTDSVFGSWQRARLGLPPVFALHPGWFFAWRCAGLWDACCTLVGLVVLAIVALALWLTGVTVQVGHAEPIGAVAIAAAFFLLASLAKRRRLRDVYAMLPANRGR